MVAEGADGALAGEFGGVVELGDVRGLAGVEGLFEDVDDGLLEGYDGGLELELRGYWGDVSEEGGEGG